MFVALNQDDERVSISDAVVRQEYYCPFCLSPLTIKKGDIISHHFSHKKGSSCSDTWSSEYDMSEWHANWQQCYPKDNQEIICQLGDIRHRADVLVDRTVIEFQHSNMSATTFSKRNHFYHELGYKVIWVFDMIEMYRSHQISGDKISELQFSWTRPRTTFKDSDILSSEIEVFFQLNEDGECALIRIDSASKYGIERFSSNRWYSKEEFLNYTGLVDGECPLPHHADLEVDVVYREFCEKYGIRLNSQQERAVQAIVGANLVLAVPGSGKTTVLIDRLGYMTLCRGIDPQRILAISYTRLAADEMKQRFSLRFGAKAAETIKFRTINSFSLDVIKKYAELKEKTPFVLKEEVSNRILRDAYQDIIEEYPTENELFIVASAISYIKNMRLNDNEIDEYAKEIQSIPNLNILYNRYKEVMIESRIMDYDDQLVYAYRIFKNNTDILEHYQNKYHYICVDEAQDTSKLQHEIIRMLSQKHNNVFMVGDEDQSIYRFRGAYPQALLNFRNDYNNPYVLSMERNYRSTPEIIDAAQHFIERNKKRYSKHMISVREHGKPIDKISVESRKEQYKFLIDVAKEPHEQIAILYRENESAVPLVDALIRSKTKYYLLKPKFSFFSSRVVLDVISFLKLVIDPFDIEAFMQIYYKCGLWLEKQKALHICEISQKSHTPIFDVLLHEGGNNSIIEKVSLIIERLRAAKEMPSKEAVEHIYNNIYKGYAKTHGVDAGKIEIIKILAENEPVIEDFLKRIAILPNMIMNASQKSDNALLLSTIHSSKGMEYNTVYILDAYNGYLPSVDPNGNRNIINSDNYQEERRLFYVAMTRAQNELNMFRINNRESSFVDEVFPEPPKKFCKEEDSVIEFPSISSLLRSNDSSQSEKAAQIEGRERMGLFNRTNLLFRNNTPPKPEAESKETKYKKGYEEVKNLFTQQDTIIRDSYGQRWVQCKKCNEIKPAERFASYGGETGGIKHYNIGLCEECSRGKSSLK